MTMWFTSDTHFGHTNIIHYCARPFANVEAMNEALIANWNERVRPGDIVYHLGDFCMGTNHEPILRRLNGQKWLIVGNHDREVVRKCGLWTEVRYYHEIKYQKKMACLMHYPLRTWNGVGRGSYMLFGHVHGTLDGRGRSMDVGVDSIGFSPISWEEIIQEMEQRDVWGEDYHATGSR